jgi:hypothetical protein
MKIRAGFSLKLYFWKANLKLRADGGNMKTTLKISILLNGLLLGGTLLLWRHPWTVTVPALTAPPMAAKVEPQAAPAPLIKIVAAPFRWNQLVSTNDFRAFVANLRATGCPESTVEDIVRGDTERAFSWERRRLGIDGNQPGPWSSQVQTQMVAYFLGQGPVPVTEELAKSQSPVNQPTGATLPLVLQNVDLSTLKLNDDETNAIASIRETFLNAIGDANQDANDPTYQTRWQKARSQADTMLEGSLGEEDFQEYQIKVDQMLLQTAAGN